MDLDTSVLSGWEATRLLKQDPATSAIPVVALTAHDAGPERLRASGFCACARKPVAPRDLIRAVELCFAALGEAAPWIDLQAFGSARLPEP